MSSPVQKNDTIFVPAEKLGGTGDNKVTVVWSESLKERSAEYWVCKYTVTSGSE